MKRRRGRGRYGTARDATALIGRIRGGAPHHPRMMLGQRVKPDDDEEYDEEAEDMLFEGEGKALNPNQAGNPWGLFGGNAYGNFPCPRGCGKVCSRRSALGMHLKSNCMNPLPKGQRRENWGNQVDTLADYDDDEEEEGNQEAEAIMMEGAEEEAYDGQDEDIDVLDVHGEPVAKEAEGYRLFRSRKSKSGYMGVTQISSGRFKAQGPHRKECGPHHGGTYIGVYDTPAEAAVAFAKHVKEYGFDPESLYAGRPADLALWRAGLKPSGRKDANETEQEDSHEEKERAFDGGGGGLLGDESEEGGGGGGEGGEGRIGGRVFGGGAAPEVLRRDEEGGEGREGRRSEQQQWCCRCASSSCAEAVFHLGAAETPILVVVAVGVVCQRGPSSYRTE